MKRRDVLAGLSGSLAVSLTGCTTVGPGEKDCLGETWTGLSFKVFLDEITYDGDTDQWTGTCKLSVSLDYVRGSGAGIRDAGIGLYDEDGHRISLLPLGDMTWQQVPTENRSEMNCGGYKQGSFTRTREFSVDQFPYYVGLWFPRLIHTPSNRKTSCNTHLTLQQPLTLAHMTGNLCVRTHIRNLRNSRHNRHPTQSSETELQQQPYLETFEPASISSVN